PRPALIVPEDHQRGVLEPGAERALPQPSRRTGHEPLVGQLDGGGELRSVGSLMGGGIHGVLGSAALLHGLGGRAPIGGAPGLLGKHGPLIRPGMGPSTGQAKAAHATLRAVNRPAPVPCLPARHRPAATIAVPWRSWYSSARPSSSPSGPNTSSTSLRAGSTWRPTPPCPRGRCSTSSSP